MINPDQFERVERLLPVLQRSSPELKREFQRSVSFARIPGGRDVFVEGEDIQSIALLLSGEVRVYKIGETGREITLYRFGQGESCVLTANAILSRQTFPAIATVEKEAEVVLIPAEAFRDWVKRYDAWREYVFDLFSQRLSTVMAVVDEVVFQQMDRRLATLIYQRALQQNPLHITHQEIAAELGSSREVISRLIEDLAGQEILRLRRGVVEVLDAARLKTRSLV